MPDVLSEDELATAMASGSILMATGSEAIDAAVAEAIGKEQTGRADHAEGAIKMLESQSYGLVLVGWDLPGAEGLSLIDRIRSHDRLKKLPIVMVGSRKSKEDVAAAMNAGADDYLIFPFERSALVDKVRNLVGRQHVRKAVEGEALQSLPDELSQGEVDHLLAGAISQEAIDQLLTGEGAQEAKQEMVSRPIITYDFRHPTQVSKEQIRMFENLHANLARMMAASFSTEQRSVVDCEIAFVDQTTYAEFIMSLSNPSCSYTFSMEPLGGPAILDFSLPIVYSFIDRQFGGAGTNPPKEARQLTSIERTVMAKVVTRALANLEATWDQLIKIQVSDAELETNPEFMQVAAPSDTALLIAFEVNTQHASGLVNLCYPYFTLEPVMAYLTTPANTGHQRSMSDAQRSDRTVQVGLTTAEVTTVLATGEVPLRELTHLRPGDVIALNAPADGPAVVFVGDKPKFLGRPAHDGGRQVVQITQRIPKAQQALYMDEVQKTRMFDEI